MPGDRPSVPPHLKGYEDQFKQNPRAAAVKWFTDARFGLFIHYGLYSLLGRHEWVQYREKIPLAEYEKLKDQFTAEKFDADSITDLAMAAEMRYITITSKHHEGFCLFRTKETDYNSLNSPAKRDLMGEMAEACQRKGLGLFFYYSYAADWHHPYFCSIEAGWRAARPQYEQPEPRYLFRQDEDMRRYIEYVHNQLRELLTQYGPVAGMWFDPIMGYYLAPRLFPIDETYALVRSLQPHCLISFKQGANGDEDFVAPERKVGPKEGELAAKVWELNKNKPREICDTLQPHGWGYIKADDGKHKTPDQVIEMLRAARRQNANLLLNTGPLGDGSIHPEDVATLRAVGERLRKDGFPQ